MNPSLVIIRLIAIIETTYGGELSLFEAEMRTLFSRTLFSRKPMMVRRWTVSALPQIDELRQIEDVAHAKESTEVAVAKCKVQKATTL